jgi:ribonuclease HII
LPDFSLEDAARGRGFIRVTGVDEAGRGPWAGPVVAGAAVLEPAQMPPELLSGLDDSKKLSAKRLEELFSILGETAVTSVGIATVEEIDELNILQASLLAMRRAVDGLPAPVDYALIDGNKWPGLSVDGETVVKGDGRSFSIAAASIVAKVTRDRIMVDLDRTHPGYGWASNAGYGTAEHQAGLAQLGVTPHHRKSFAPIRKMLDPTS